MNLLLIADRVFVLQQTFRQVCLAYNLMSISLGKI